MSQELDRPTRGSYTPEYSNELLCVIIETFKEDISLYLSDLKLKKMIDLIEIAEYNFEKYQLALEHDEFNTSLQHFIIGLFYIYMIIPNSIQFQIKNKNYEVFLTLKQLFENQLNMSNVKLQVINYIDYLSKKNSQHETASMTPRSRSKTLPSSALQKDLSRLLKSSDSDSGSDTDPVEEGIQAPGLGKPADVITISSGSSIQSIRSHSRNSSIVDDLWEPPDLQPNDQLQLANNFSSDSVEGFYSIPEVPSSSPPPIPSALQSIKHANTFPVNFESRFEQLKLDNFANEVDKDFEGNYLREIMGTTQGHRKDSYHSVYANGDEDEKTVPTISCKDLYSDLSSRGHSYLIFDLRSSKSFNSNHIPYGNIINIDPSLIIDSDSLIQLEDVLRCTLDYDTFTKLSLIKSYDCVLSYTDNATFFASKLNFISKFYQLLDDARIRSRTISGGFDSWTKYISKNFEKSKDTLRFEAKPLQKSPALDFNLDSLVSSENQASETPYPSDYSQFLPEQVHHKSITNNSTSSLHVTTAYADSPLVTSGYARGILPPLQVPSQAPPHLPSHMARQVQVPQVPQHYSNQYYQSSFNNSNRIPGPFFADGYATHHSQSVPNNGYDQRNYREDAFNYNNQPPSRAPPQPHHITHTQLAKQKINIVNVPTIQNNPQVFVRLSITGLRNLGNTCYINSMIQCLFASNMFRNVFLENKFLEYYNPKFQKTKLSPALSLLFKKMFLNGGCSIVPTGFLKACNELRPDLGIPSKQQDTQEFLMFMLDHLHDELSNSNTVVNDYPELMNHESLGDEYNNWFENLIKQGFSPISRIFQGQLQDSLECLNCGFKTSNFSTFYMLSLVIPKVGPNGKKLKKILLEDCIKLFTNDEILTGDNAWECPKCSKKPKPPSVVPVEKEHRRMLHFGSGLKFRSRSSSPMKRMSKKTGNSSSKSSSVKSLTFVSLPPILIIHLSRFLFYDSSQKDEAVVQYPLILEIPHHGVGIHYRLFAVINHSGTLKSGHYTSIANKNLTHDLRHPDWYYFDDEIVKDTQHGGFSAGQPTHMASSDVYLLFYERIN